jgi:hypothetical protein
MIVTEKYRLKIAFGIPAFVFLACALITCTEKFKAHAGTLSWPLRWTFSWWHHWRVILLSGNPHHLYIPCCVFLRRV